MDKDLQLILESGIISKQGLEDAIYMAAKKEILKKYHIWQGKNGRFHAHIRVGKSRKLISKATEKDLIEYLRNVENNNEKNTLLDICLIYFSRKAYEWTDNTKLRNEQYFKKYLKNEPIMKRPIHKITGIELENFLRELVIKNELTRKAYNNAIAPVRFAFDYATFDGVNIREQNLFAQIKLPTKLFKQVRKPSNETQVFSDEEQQLLTSVILANYKTSTPLAIILNFYLGLRVGELMALKWNDIHEEYIHIERMEQRHYDDNNHLNRVIVEHTKTDAGTRDVPLTEKAKEILALIRQFDSVDDFIFCNDGKRTTSKGLECALKRYCAKAGIPYKSSHKIRKTFISTLIDNNVNINSIREMVGHQDAQTTYNSYCYNRKDITAVTQQLNQILQ